MLVAVVLVQPKEQVQVVLVVVEQVQYILQLLELPLYRQRPAHQIPAVVVAVEHHKTAAPLLGVQAEQVVLA
jgi:hypothetical protein